MSKIFGASNYNNEQLECAICIPNVNFISDYYTTMYITLDGARDTLSNSDQYDRFIKENKVIVENIASEQQSFLRDRLVKEASGQLEENEKLFHY